MRKLGLFALSFTAAAAGYVYLRLGWTVLALAGAALVGALALRLRGPNRASVLLLGLAVGVTWCAAYQIVWLSPANRLVGQTLPLEVRVSALPEETAYGVMAEGELTLTGRTFGVTVYCDALPEGTKPGDILAGTFQVERTGWDTQAGESLYQRSRGTFLTLSAEDAVQVETGTPRWYEAIHLWLRARLEQLYEGQTLAFLRALVTGDHSGFSYETENELAVTGLSHAVAVSGMHVAILVMVLRTLFQGAPRPTALVGIPLSVAFALMTGATPSACRAALMQILLLLAPLLRREYDVPTALGGAALLLLLPNPWTVANVSFQLSFGAVAGLALLGEPIRQRLVKWKLPDFAANCLSATAAATAMTLPLTMFYFRTVSLVSPLSNLLCLSAVTASFLLGMLSAVAGPLGPLAAIPARWVTRYILAVVDLLAGIPWAAAYEQNPALLVWAVGAMVIAVGLLAFGWKRRKLLGGFLAVTFTAAAVAGHLWLTAGEMTLTVLDVGQGQSLLLESGGFTAVLDCGGTDPQEAGETMARTLLSAGLTKVDVLALTHFDADHSGGAMQLLRRVDVGLVLLPALAEPDPQADAIAAVAEKAGAQVLWISEKTGVEFSGGALIVYPPMGADRNDGLAILASVGEYDMLVTGDCDMRSEQALLEQYSLPQVELLVAGHHGAAESTSQALLRWVQPETVVISVGAENHYGHPDQETLARIEAAGAAVLRTDQDGTLFFRR